MRQKEPQSSTFAKLNRGDVLVGIVDRSSDGDFGRSWCIASGMIGRKGKMEAVEDGEIWIGENASLRAFRLDDEKGATVMILCDGMIPTPKGEMRSYRVALPESVEEIAEALNIYDLPKAIRDAWRKTFLPPPATAPRVNPTTPEEIDDDLPF